LLGSLFTRGIANTGVSDELNEFLKRYRDRLVTLAKEGSSVKLVSSLERLQELVHHWAQIARDSEPGTTPLWFGDGTRHFAGPLAVDLYEVVAKCMASGDADKAEAVIDFLSDVAQDAFALRHLRLFDAATGLLAVAYVRGIRNDTIAQYVGESLDARVGSLLSRFEGHRRISLQLEDAADRSRRIEQEQPLLDAAVAVGLSMIRYAVAAERGQDALNIFERIFGKPEPDLRG
jgi:hypothetical protein